MIDYFRARRAAIIGANWSATRAGQDPARTVGLVRKVLGKHADRARISVSRPSRVGGTTGVGVTLGGHHVRRTRTVIE